MERRVAVVGTLALAVALATVPTGGLAQSESASIAPGERFAGVVGVQETEIQGAVESRAFGIRFERADSNASRARLIAGQVNETRERLRELRERKERLREARRNGSISEGQYRARMARLVAQSNALQQRLNRTIAASNRVPDRALRERGVDPAELDRLRAAAGNLTGPAIAAIARNITGGTGPPAGVGPGEARGDRGRGRGPPDDAGNANRGNRTDAGPPDGAGSSGNAGNRSDGPTSGGADRGNRGATGDRSGGENASDGTGGTQSDGADRGADGAGSDRGTGGAASGESGNGSSGTSGESGNGSSGTSGESGNGSSGTSEAETGRDRSSGR